MVWNPVTNIKGPKGEKGDTGAQGVQGTAGSTTIAGISGLQASLDSKAPQDLSSTTETTLNGTEQVPIWKGGFFRTTVAKICAWIVARANTWAATQTFSAGAVGKGSGADASPAFSADTSGGSYASMWARRGAPFYTYKADNGSSYGPSISMVYTHSSAYVGVYSIGVLNHAAGNAGSCVINHINAAGGDVYAWLFSGLDGSFTCPGAISVSGVAALNGGAKLGELSPALKVKVVTGTVSATAGDTTSVAHGLPSAANILGTMTTIQNNVGKWWMSNSVAGTWFMSLFDDASVSIYTQAGNSTSITGRPFRTTIFYTT